MEELALSTESSCGTIKVVLLRKNIKNVHLRVYRDMTVKLSVPYCVQTEWIENFLNSRKDWIVCLLYTSPSPRDTERSRMPSSA